MSKWISVKDALPVIPENNYGVSVLVAEYDEMYHESCGPKGAYTVYEVSYFKLDERHQRGWESVYGSSENMPKEDFVTTFSNGAGDSYPGPIIDEVTHWMYLPEPPEVPELECTDE
jgi:hypothetical protein